MTLDEAIDEQFENLNDSDSVKVRVHCILTTPTRGGQYGKYFLGTLSIMMAIRYT